MIIFSILSLVSGLVCPGSRQVCVDIQQKGSVYQFNVSGPSREGYKAIGLGESMNKADMFITWFDGSGKPVVSHQTSSGHQQPSPKKASLEIVAHDEQHQYITFTCPLPQPQGFATLSTAETNSMIWAYSPEQPLSDGSIAYHQEKGVFGYSFQGDSPVEIYPGIPSYLLWHGALMIIAWLILPSVAIFIARFLKDHMGAAWFMFHKVIFFLAGVVAISSIALVYYNQGPALSNPHAVIGVVIMTLYVGQVILGFVIDKLWNPENPEAPWHDKLHWWVGRSLALCAFGNIVYGLILLENPLALWIPTAIILVFIFAGFAVAEKKIGKVAHYNQIAD